MTDTCRTVVRSIDALQTGTYSSAQYAYITVTCYHTTVTAAAICAGGGDFDRISYGSSPCTSTGLDNGGTIIQDSAHNCFYRKNFGTNGIVDARQFGLRLDGSTDESAQANTVLSIASSLGLETVVFPGVLDQAGADLTVPDGMTVDFGAAPVGKRNDHDYTAATIPGGILLPSSHKVHLGCSSSLRNGTAVRSGDTYAPATFIPSSMRDKLNVQASFAGTAVLADCDYASIINFSLFGFGSMDGTVPAIELNGQGMHLSHVAGDCMLCVYQHDSGGGAVFDDFAFLSYLTRGGGNLTWKVDNETDDGTGAYKIVAEAPPVSDGGDVDWVNGDILYVLRAAGAQSATGQHTISNVAVVANGTDGCLIAHCQEATLVGTHSAPTGVSATWAETIRTDGNFPVTIDSVTTAGHSIDDLAVGQTFDDTGSCLTGGVIKDVWPAKNIVYLDPATLTVTCAGTAAAATATDTGYSHNGVPALKMSSAQRRTTAMKFINAGGTKMINGQVYTHDVEIECGDQAESLRIVNINTGEDSGDDEPGNIGLLIDGEHRGKDCSGLTWTGGVLGQGVTRGIVVDSDFDKPDVFTGLGSHPGAAHLNGVALEIEAGNVTFQGVYTLSPGNVLMADGTEYRVPYVDKGNEGHDYQLGDKVTVASGHGTVCDTYPYIIVTEKDSGGGITGFTSTLGVNCTAWGSNPMPTTTDSFSGSGAKLDTDGFISGSLLATGSNFADSEFYRQTYPGAAFHGTSNNCQDSSACNDIYQGSTALPAALPPVGVIDRATASVSTGTGISEQVLHSYTLPANALDIAGRNLRISACFQKAANTHSVTPRIYFGSVAFGTSTTGSGVVSCLEMRVLKTGANTQNVVATGSHGTGTIAPAYTAGTQTDTAAITIKATAQDGTSAAGDETLVSFTVEYLN